MRNSKRNLEIYKKYHQGCKTGVLIKTYKISRQRIHQILIQVSLLEENKNKIISKEAEYYKELEDKKLCGSCKFYDSNGFCDNFQSKDTCADRDKEAVCDIGQYVYEREL